jgi:hypothetical protein
MRSAEVKFRKLTRWKAKKPYSDRLTTRYWHYSHQVNGDLIKARPW